MTHPDPRSLVVRFSLVAACLLFVAAAPPAHAVDAPADSASPVAKLRTDAAALRPLVRSELARAFLDATRGLPRVAPRTIYRDSARTRAWTQAEADALPDTMRARLVPRPLDESFYWNTRYGSPLAYARPLELLARHGLRRVDGLKIADFGCGTLGHLRLLASLGADATGIDIDPLLRALYAAPGDQGEIAGSSGRRGRLRLVTGQWPASESIVREVGGGYDLILSKNTLKNGYIHPAQQVDPRMLVHLGVDDSTFVATLWRSLKPGGLVLVYNLSPAPAPPGKPYVPWADGRCPFPRGAWERAGFKVVTFDADDGPNARAMGHALGWDQGEGAMDLEKDLFAHWSLFEKPAR